MPDLDHLAPPVRAGLNVKFDGYIEACVALAHLHNVGLGEALSLATLALLRELHARGLDRCQAMALIAEEAEKLWPPQPALTLS